MKPSRSLTEPCSKPPKTSLKRGFMLERKDWQGEVFKTFNPSLKIIREATTAAAFPQKSAIAGVEGGCTKPQKLSDVLSQHDANIRESIAECIG
jgi:hypothetical protein